MTPADQVAPDEVLDEGLNAAALAVRAAADARRDAPMQRRNILSVQGCSGCGRPRKQKIKTPFGMRSIFSRLKMTLLPGVVADLPPHASGTMPRRATVQAPLCKSCRKVALTSVGTPSAVAEGPLVLARMDERGSAPELAGSASPLPNNEQAAIAAPDQEVA